SYNTVVDGFKIQNWSYYDSSPTATNASHVPSQYAVFLNWALGSITDVTIRNSELVNNNGGGVIHAHGTGRVTIEYNPIHDNWTHGWTSPVSFWNAVGKNEGPNVYRGNTVYNNQDDPPLFCIPKYCGGSKSNTNACVYDQFTNKVASSPQGYGCSCGA